MAPAASAVCIRLGRVDPLFEIEDRSFRIVNQTEAEDEGCPSNTIASTNFVQQRQDDQH
jgi:hypothetical protein